MTKSELFKGLKRITSTGGEVRIIRRFRENTSNIDGVSVEMVELAHRKGWLRQVANGGGLELYKLTKSAPRV